MPSVLIIQGKQDLTKLTVVTIFSAGMQNESLTNQSSICTKTRTEMVEKNRTKES